MTYVCPMHPAIRQNEPGACKTCGMALVAENSVSAAPKESIVRTYRPLLVIVGLILLAAVTATLASDGTFQDGMTNFMAGFFLVFAGLKLLDVPGFARGYAKYDLLAIRVKAYGYLYPFLELALGLAYLTRFEPHATNVVTVILMLFSGVGVAIKVAKREKFQCACLGTMIKVPLTNITLIEDFGMAAMAAAMLMT